MLTSLKSLTPNSIQKKYTAYKVKRKYGLKNAHPILISQMGKVGSSSLFNSLVEMDLPIPVIHVHLLNNLDKIEAGIRASRQNPTDTLREIHKSRQIRADIDTGKLRHINVISAVRDPVKRNVSAFFQSIEEIIPDYKNKYLSGRLTVEELVDIFVHQYDHSAPVQWFDSQVRDVFGIDVFESPFPIDIGYKIYQTSSINLLIVRLENLSQCVQPAMKEFLNIRDFKIRSSNVSSDKAYGPLYKEFIANAKMPEFYLDAMYQSKYCQHFYSAQEIREFRKLWIR